MNGSEISIDLCVIFYALSCVTGTPCTTVDYGLLNHEAPPRLGVMFNRSAFNTVFFLCSFVVGILTDGKMDWNTEQLL